MMHSFYQSKTSSVVELHVIPLLGLNGYCLICVVVFAFIGRQYVPTQGGAQPPARCRDLDDVTLKTRALGARNERIAK